MAELNARIIAKASGVSGEAPQSVDLQPAELAVNTADGKLFTKHTDGTIKEIGGGGSSDVESINDLSDVQFDVISSALAYRKGNADNPGEYDQRVLNKTYVYLNQYDANGVDINDVLPAGSYDVYVSDDQGQTWVVNAGSGESGFTSVQLDGGERWLLLGLPTGNSWAPGNSGAELSGDILVSTSAEVTITTLLPDEGDVLRWDDVEEKFRPVPLPEAPAAPVTSVNGETGAVSLGIQDMNDYDLNFIVPTSSGARVNISEYDMDTSDGGWSLSSNLIIDHVNADGVNEYDNSGWVSQLGVGTGLYMTDESGNVFLETIGGYYGVTVELTGPFAPRSYFSLSDDAQTFLSQLPLGAQVTFALGDPLSIVYAPLAEGDILQWNSLDQKFKPAQLSAGGGIEEAPEDGTPYVRQDAGWVSAPSGGGGGDSVFDLGDVTEDTAPGFDGLTTLVAPQAVNIQQPDEYFLSSTSLYFYDGIPSLSAVQVGDVITLQASDANATQFVGTVEAFALSGLSIRWKIVGGIDSAFRNIVDAANGTLLVFGENVVGSASLPPTTGQALVYSGLREAFVPTDVPASVNGETGDVSLGIQDMDDFELNPVTQFVYDFRWETKIGSGNTQPGEWGTNQLRWDETDSDGKTYSATGAQQFWISPDTLVWTEVNAFVTHYTNGGANYYYINLPQFDSPEKLYMAFTEPPNPEVTEEPLQEGDILQWDNTDQKFKPAQLVEFTEVDGGTFGSG